MKHGFLGKLLALVIFVAAIAALGAGGLLARFALTPARTGDQRPHVIEVRRGQRYGSASWQ